MNEKSNLFEIPQRPDVENLFLEEVLQIQKQLRSMVNNNPEIKQNAHKIAEDLETIVKSTGHILAREYTLSCSYEGGPNGEVRVVAVDKNQREILVYHNYPSLYQPEAKLKQTIAQKTKIIPSVPENSRLNTKQPHRKRTDFA